LPVALLAVALLSLSTPAAAEPAAAAARRSLPGGAPLADALRRFSRESGYDVVFPEELVRGKRAAAVRDPRSAYDVVTQMLAGSGLAPRFVRRDAFILEPLAPPTPPALALDPIEVLTPPVGEQAAAYRWYGDRLLEVSLSVLRRSPALAMRSYDFTLYVWLSGEGRVIDLDGQGTETNTESLGIAKELLRDLMVGVTPPPNMPQPVGLRITAQ